MEEEYKPRDNTLYLKCLLRLMKDVTLVEIREYNGDPERISLKKGLKLVLVDNRITFCATVNGCGSGPLVRIEETKGVEIENRYIGRTVVMPSELLELHPNVL